VNLPEAPRVSQLPKKLSPFGIQHKRTCSEHPERNSTTALGYMANIYRNNDILAKTVGGLDNHAHLLFQLPASLTLAKAVYLVKTSSSKWMKQFMPDFDCQEGYGAFSVSASQLEPVIKYIDNQGSYHKKISFEREYVALLKKYGVEYDPRYVFG
jgi:putative transposase